MVVNGLRKMSECNKEIIKKGLSLLEDKNYEEAFKVSMACGCATAFSSGLADYDTIHECYDRLGNERIILG